MVLFLPGIENDKKLKNNYISYFVVEKSLGGVAIKAMERPGLALARLTGCYCVSEGANMPSTPGAILHFHKK